MTDDEPQTALAGLHVLIVEDELMIMLEIEAILEDQGCVVVGPASSTPAALDAIARERTDLAVLDVNLRGKRSTPIAAALHERDTPYVVVSGYRAGALDDPALAPAAWLSKPVDRVALVRALAEAARTARPSKA